jgi:ribosomal protein S18 acetylase RimI-like enzyme
MFEIVESSHTDLPELTQCYKSAFPGSLTAAMGKQYVSKILSWFLEVPGNFLFHIREMPQNRIVGFCGGLINDGITKRGSASEMIQFAFWVGIRSIAFRPWLLFHKEMRNKYGLASKNARRKILRQKGKSTYSPGRIKQPYTGLVVIGIHESFQNRGISKALLNGFEDWTRKLGYSCMRLSVKSDNIQAIKAYQKSGWIILDKRNDSVSMVKEISK